MRWYSFLLLMVLVSCKKEQINAEFISVDVHSDLDVRDIVLVNNDTLYACGGVLWTGGFIARSIDAGQTWDLVYNHWKVINTIDINSKHEILAGSHWGGTHFSSNGGDSWLYNENAEISAVNDLVFINDSISMLATGESFYFGGYCLYNAYSNSYEFANYSQSFASLAFFDENNGVMGAYGTIYTTEDGGNHIAASNISGDFFKGIAFNDSGEGLAIGYQGKIAKSINYGKTWDKIDRKGSFFTTKKNLECVAVYETKAIICGQDGILLYTDNLGDSWKEIDHPFGKRNFFKVKFINNNQAWLCGEGGLLCKMSL